MGTDHNDRLGTRIAALLALLGVLLVSAMTAAPSAAAASTATLTYPVANAQNVDTAKAFTWTTASGAQAYYLYVGTSSGGSDLVNSGETTATSYRVPPLPPGQQLYARIWTKAASSWSFSDVTFTPGVATSTLTRPQNGDTLVDTSKPFTWTASPGALAYTLYIGTSQGSKDVYSSGETQQTSLVIPSTPLDTVLWARLWTKKPSGWAWSDLSFTAAFRPAALIYPPDGATNVSTLNAFTWAAVPKGDAYFLYIGSAAGASDLFASGEISATSSVVPALPLSQVLFARLWTRSGTNWFFSDTTFSAGRNAATLTYPIAGAVITDASLPLQWNATPGAISYIVTIGSSQGATDLYSGGETHANTLLAPVLPLGTVWIRLTTRSAGGNVSRDTSVTVAYDPSVLTYPAANAGYVDTSAPFRWTVAPNAQAYYLYIGTSKGASDLLDSGEIQTASFSVPPLPAKVALWARLWTKKSSGWYSSDLSFQAAPRFIFPVSGSVGVATGQPFSWSPIGAGSVTYRLIVGSTPAASDLYDSGTIATPSATIPVSALPAGRTLFAHVETVVSGGNPSIADSVFTVAGTPVQPAHMTAPVSGATSVDTSNPFEWAGTPLASAYRLQLRSGTTVVVDSGEISSTRYFAESLPAGSYVADLASLIAGTWYHDTTTFVVATSGSSMAKELASAEWATDVVRSMATMGNSPYLWTPLYRKVSTTDYNAVASCGQYSKVLLDLLKGMNLAARLPAAQAPRSTVIGFVRNYYEEHVITELFNTDDQRWIVLDPTFDLVMTRASDGHLASKEDAQAATAAKAWGNVQYTFLGAAGDAYARQYYLDYPLLYLNLSPLPPVGGGRDVLAYLTRLAALPTGNYGGYLFNSNQNPTDLIIDGVRQSVDFSGVDAVSKMFLASSVTLPADSTATVIAYRPNRYVF